MRGAGSPPRQIATGGSVTNELPPNSYCNVTRFRTIGTADNPRARSGEHDEESIQCRMDSSQDWGEAFRETKP
jgi:hypothetical protein